MRLPSTVCLSLALLGAGTLVPTVASASSSPQDGTEDHDITIAEDILAKGVSYTFIRDGDPKKPFTLTEGTTEEEPVKIRSVKSAPTGLTVTFSGSTFTLKGSAGGTITFETQFRDVAVSIGVNKKPDCDGGFKELLGNGQGEILVDPEDLCVDPEGIVPTLTGLTVKSSSGGTWKTAIGSDGLGKATVEGDGSAVISYKVSDNGNIGEGTFTITTRDWDPIFRVADGGDTTATETELAAALSTKDDPLKAVAVDVVDPDEQVAFNICCGGFTLTTRDWDPILRAPVVEGEFTDASGTPVYATWDVEVNDLPECTDLGGTLSTKDTSIVLSLADRCKDPEGDPILVRGVTVDGKEAKYAYDATKQALTVYLPYTKEAGSGWKIQARIANGKDPNWPFGEPIFTPVYRDDF